MTVQDEINEQNALIEKELNNWEELGATPQNITVDTFILDAYVHALVTYLVDTGVVQDEEFTLHFKKRLLGALITTRENIAEPAIREIRRQQITNGMPNMEIPKGKPHLH